MVIATQTKTDPFPMWTLEGTPDEVADWMDAQRVPPCGMAVRIDYCFAQFATQAELERFSLGFRTGAELVKPVSPDVYDARKPWPGLKPPVRVIDANGVDRSGELVTVNTATGEATEVVRDERGCIMADPVTHDVVTRTVQLAAPVRIVKEPQPACIDETAPLTEEHYRKLLGVESDPEPIIVHQPQE